MPRRLERQRHDAATAERAARAERGAETERRERQAQLLLRPVRAQQPLWPHPWRPLQLAMHADALRYKQGKKEIAIPLRHVTHVNVVDNDRYLPPSPPPLPPTPPAPRPTTCYSLYSLLTAHHSPLTTHHSPWQVRVRHPLARQDGRLPCGGRLCDGRVGAGAAEQGGASEPRCR